jgi:hypothetical protein
MHEIQENQQQRWIDWLRSRGIKSPETNPELLLAVLWTFGNDQDKKEVAELIACGEVNPQQSTDQESL